MVPGSGNSYEVLHGSANTESNITGSIGTATPGDYFALMKPRVMSLVVFTAWVGYICAPLSLPPWNAIMAILAIAAGAGSAGALNMWYDADIDARMTRTRKRPVPRGVVSRNSALTFGIIVGAFSIWMLGLATNYVASGLLAFTIFFYAAIYSMWLKRRTPQNIVIGGAAGAFPPVIGWAAATGEVTVNAVILFAIIFFWTPPHFWALALCKTSDYDKAGIPMMPNVKGAASTRLQIFIYTVILSGVAILPVFTGLAGQTYAIAAFALNTLFIALALQVRRSQAGETARADKASLYAVGTGNRAARNLFAFSMLYLFGLFGALAVDVVIGDVANV
ncbi:MAG: protoheme IX farnesyltransferase [Hyphomonadaceae bacterium]|nr:protoheme IX farnesyltransferase [Hyphomonadaceae bacterium]